MQNRRVLKTLIAGLGLALVAQIGTAQSIPRPGGEGLVQTITLTGPDEPYLDSLDLPAGKSMVLRFDVPISEATVGDPEKADIVPMTDRSIYVLGREHGSTNLTVLGANKRVLGIIDLQVSHDLVGLKRRLHELMPGELIEVRSNNDTVMLSGRVSSSAVVARAQDLAESFAPGKVLNAIELGASQQVMLAVRFAEVERNAAKALGISTNAIFGDERSPITGLRDGFSSNFIAPVSVDSGSFAFLRDSFGIGDATIDVILDALEERGVANILAEPTLIAISGEEASFLAGGEFPVPVSSSAEDGVNKIEIEFKEFGVRLKFTPTVIGDTISLVVSPEVSELDPLNGVVLNNISIPGLRTRRATTTVELKHGQSFSIAGLMQKKFLDELEQLPGLGSTPILGALARSARYKRQETELAIIITPYIVTPSDPSVLTTPIDTFTRPHEFELFFLGKTEGGATRSGLFGGNTIASGRSALGPTQASIGYVVD